MRGKRRWGGQYTLDGVRAGNLFGYCVCFGGGGVKLSQNAWWWWSDGVSIAPGQSVELSNGNDRMSELGCDLNAQHFPKQRGRMQSI